MEKTREELIALINDCNNEQLLQHIIMLLLEYEDIVAD